MSKDTRDRTDPTLPPHKTQLMLLDRYFQPPKELPPPSKEQIKARKTAACVMDPQGRTAIELKREDGTVTFIPMDQEGCFVVQQAADKFDARYSRRASDSAAPEHLKSYPVERAAKLYLGHMTIAGGSAEAFEALAKLVTPTDKEKEEAMAKQKDKNTDPNVTTRKVAPPTGKALKDRDPKAAGAKKGAAPVKAEASEEGKRGRGRPAGEAQGSVATMFRKLIMEGKLTDDEIFAAVKKEHELSDDKRKYVAWYRNQLKKQGKNPPDAKKGKKDED